ncbi:MAG: segregation/condensation protein A [Candidatus Aenigmarchaeota archaeon]|nr:segregation/condensation protein A [Candidatus Aenigmarchaeota archaeon]MDW8149700.1 segregation/condensation protein A [Candidatus Aenigmarchaeota archaeon]
MILEEKIINEIINKESWEEIIYYVVSLENLNPWDIDLVRLCDGFMNFLNKVIQLDFRIPARVLFVASILLRIKAEYLIIKEEVESEKTEKIESVKKIDVYVENPLRRIPKGPVTLNDLIIAFKKIIDLKEKKERRIWERRREIEIKIGEARDFEKRIEEVYKKIIDKIKDKEYVLLKHVVDEWNVENIVNVFLPILHLDNKNLINCVQEEFFDEIKIFKS